MKRITKKCIATFINYALSQNAKRNDDEEDDEFVYKL